MAGVNFWILETTLNCAIRPKSTDMIGMSGVPLKTKIQSILRIWQTCAIKVSAIVRHITPGTSSR